MPDTPAPEESGQEQIQAEEENIYGAQDDEIIPTIHQDLAEAMRPTEDDYAPFSPPEPPPSIEEPVERSDGEDDGHGDNSLPESFDPRWKEEFEGLLFLGRLQRSFSWMGHRFTIKSLGTDDILAISLVQKPYIGQMGEMKAYQAAAVAASLIEVDGRPMPFPVSRSPDSYEEVQAKFEYVTRNYSPIIIDVIYNASLELEQKVAEVIVAMGKASG